MGKTKHSKNYQDYARAYKTARDYATRHGLKFNQTPPSKMGNITRANIEQLKQEHIKTKEYTKTNKIGKVKEEKTASDGVGQSIVVDNLYAIPDSMSAQNPRASMWLHRYIDRQVKELGVDAVVEILLNADPELIAQCAVVIYYDLKSNSGADAMETLTAIFSLGEIKTSEEMKEIQEVAESDVYAVDETIDAYFWSENG